LSKFIKHSRTYFILGLLIGLGIGLFFSLYTKNKDSINNLSSVIFNYADSSFNSDDKNEKKPVVKKKKVKKKKRKQTIKEVKLDSIINDSVYFSADSVLQADTISDTSLVHLNDSSIIDTINSSNKDSLFFDDTIAHNQLENDTQSIQDNEMIIAQDELIYSEYFIPQGKRNDFLCRTDVTLDSILTNNIVTRDQEGIYVEFWRSPLNSTGYKLTHNTLILYGFYQYKAINLKYLKNGRLRLQYLSNSYEITCSDEFVSLQISK